MKNFDRWLSPFSQQLDEQVLRLQRAFRARLEMFRLELSRSEAKLRLLEPKTLLDALARRLDHEAVLLGNAMRNRLREQDAKLRGLEQTLEALCPTRVLERGYALVSHKKKLLRSARSLQVGDELHLRFAEGEAQAKVESIS
jgi:exodeoxyribonuclease VII large subunit